jgi:DNA-binding transcriptional MerR regulator
VTSRTYLSIGDVLTLLREEFPDVTISKIRFLESQGLVNPERSPSGYRKFFEADVERLRWVLRQQREHFLPLKVIRDRLAEGDLDDSIADPVPNPERRNGKVPEAIHAAVGNGAAAAGAGAAEAGAAGATGRSGASAVGGAGGRHAVAGRTEEQLAKADDEAMARILADASRRAALMPEVAGERTPTKASPDSTVGARSGADVAPAGPVPAPVGGLGAPKVGGVRADPTAGVTGGGRQEPGLATTGHDLRAKRAGTTTAQTGAGAKVGARPAAPGAASATTAPLSPPAAAAAPAEAPPPRQGPAAGSAAAAPRTGTAPGRSGAAGSAPRTAASTTSMVTGASLTAEEICAASGLSEIELAGLEGFGLIESTDVAGIATFDEDALTVANLAAEFRVFGIEPRHLRLYRNAVDREIGLIEQVIIPLLRQRNPESRQRAVDAAEVLGTLGQTMRATLLRSALRRHIGG